LHVDCQHTVCRQCWLQSRVRGFLPPAGRLTSAGSCFAHSISSRASVSVGSRERFSWLIGITAQFQTARYGRPAGWVHLGPCGSFSKKAHARLPVQSRLAADGRLCAGVSFGRGETFT
jgi:hypothetical protein